MFTLVRRYIKTALVFFVMGLTLGGWITFLQVTGKPIAHSLISVHTHLLLVGFMIMLIMGVAYWMFPRPAKDDYRYSPDLAAINYWFLTVGVILRSVSELVASANSWRGFIIIAAAGTLFQIIGGFIFAYNIWTRIRPTGSQLREAKGERF